MKIIYDAVTGRIYNTFFDDELSIQPKVLDVANPDSKPIESIDVSEKSKPKVVYREIEDTVAEKLLKELKEVKETSAATQKELETAQLALAELTMQIGGV